MSAPHDPREMILCTGQPMLMSRPSKPISRTSLRHAAVVLGVVAPDLGDERLLAKGVAQPADDARAARGAQAVGAGELRDEEVGGARGPDDPPEDRVGDVLHRGQHAERRRELRPDAEGLVQRWKEERGCRAGRRQAMTSTLVAPLFCCCRAIVSRAEASLW